MKQEQWDELKRLHGAATAGEWNIDTENNEGDYGSGDPDDARSGFSSYVLHAPSGTVCDTLNSDLICVNEESDEEGYVYAWDEVGGRNMKWVAALHNAFPAIVAEREAAQKENEHLRCALRYYATGQHFTRGDNDAWDTVSGEPQNFWCDEAGTATVEDGSFAAHSLRNNMEWSAEDSIPIEGEKPYLSLAAFDKESKNEVSR